MLMYVLRVYASVCAMMCTSKSCPVIKSGKLTAHDSNHHRVIWALILFKPISFTSCNCKLKTAFILNAQWSDKLHSSRCFNDNLLEVPNVSFMLKFGHSEKGTKFEKNLPIKIWHYSIVSNFKWKIFFKFCVLFRMYKLTLC